MTNVYKALLMSADELGAYLGLFWCFLTGDVSTAVDHLLSVVGRKVTSPKVVNFKKEKFLGWTLSKVNGPTWVLCVILHYSTTTKTPRWWPPRICWYPTRKRSSFGSWSLTRISPNLEQHPTPHQQQPNFLSRFRHHFLCHFFVVMPAHSKDTHLQTIQSSLSIGSDW